MKRFKKIYIEITNKCNLKCRFCPTNNRKLDSMTLENFNVVSEKIKDYTDYIYLHIKGEPLFHENIEEILQCANKYNFHVNITTNGTLLKEKKEILKNSKAIRQINISIHSIEQNNLYNSKEYFSKYLQDIMDSADEINKSLNCYISYRLWNLSNVNKIESEENIYILEQIGKRYEVSDIFEQLKKSSSIKLGNNKYINLDKVYEWPSLQREETSSEGTCYGLIDQIGILVDGTVVPCCLDQEGDMALGNIFETNFSLEEVLNSELVKKIYNGFKENKLIHPLCKRCGFRVNKIKDKNI